MHNIPLVLALWLLPTLVGAMDVNSIAQQRHSDAMRCLPDAKMTSYLDQAWAELPVALGDLDNGNPTTLFLSHRGSWTLVEHRRDGLACIEASGTRMTIDAKNVRKIATPS